MDFSLSTEQKQIRDTARQFATTEFPKWSEECDEKEKFPMELLKKLADLGFVGITIDPKYGGAGLGVIDHTIVMEELSRIDGGIAVGIGSSTFGSELLAALGSEELKNKWLPKFVKGEAISGAAITEPEAGSDVANIQTVAARKSGEFVINGTKTFITNGTIANVVVATCITHPDAERHKKFSTILVETDRPGYRATKMYGKMGIRASDTADVEFKDVHVPVANLVGEEGHGFYHVMNFFNQTRIMVAAQAVGIAQGSLDKAIEYAKARKTFGRPIAEHQGIQFKLAEMATRVEAARNLTYKAAWAIDAGKPDPKISSMAKWFAGETAVRVTDEAIQIYGGYGYMREMGIEKFHRDAKITELYEGTKEIHKLIIARALLGRIG
ncbi:MAG: acyl-CoA dehydrogenase family protein [Methanobacteriota archaeon]